MKIIDLLNTPLNKLPQKIKIEDRTYNLFIDEDTNYHYYQDDKCKYFMFSISCFEELNEEIEIIEENKKENKDKEIERLNNIIKEFEILIKNEINESKLENDYDRVYNLKYCLVTLKELKGSGNNETNK